MTIGRQPSLAFGDDGFRRNLTFRLSTPSGFYRSEDPMQNYLMQNNLNPCKLKYIF